MRVNSWVAAAFVASSGQQQPHRDTTTELSAIPFQTPPAPVDVVQQTTQPSLALLASSSSNPSTTTTTTTTTTSAGSALAVGIREWLVPSAFAADAPSKKDIELLNRAMATYYNKEGRDLDKAEQLLSEAIGVWEKQPADERAALYRIRADCHVAMKKPVDAQNDYTEAIKLLNTEEGEDADPSELPAS